MTVSLRDAMALIPDWLLTHPGVGDRAVRLYGVLHIMAQTGEPATRAILADTLRASRDTIDRALRELETAGAVLSSPITMANGRVVNHFTVLWAAPVRPPLAQPPTPETTEQPPIGEGEGGTIGGEGEGSPNQVLTTSRSKSRSKSNTESKTPETEDWEPGRNGQVTETTVVTLTRQQQLFGAFCEATGVDWTELSNTRRKTVVGMLATVIRLGATVDTITDRAQEWHHRYPDIPLTPETLVRRWAELGSTFQRVPRNDRAASLAARALEMTKPRELHGG